MTSSDETCGAPTAPTGAAPEPGRPLGTHGRQLWDDWVGRVDAAARTGRIGYGVELDPRYVDVICARLQVETGEKAVLEATGERHDFTGD